MALTFKELRGMSDEDLIAEHDRLAAGTGVIGTREYLDELARRDANRQGERMVKLTAVITALTVVIAALTVVNVLAVVLGSG